MVVSGKGRTWGGRKRRGRVGERERERISEQGEREREGVLWGERGKERGGWWGKRRGKKKWGKTTRVRVCPSSFFKKINFFLQKLTSFQNKKVEGTFCKLNYG